jgi:hypothetical protein
MLDAVSGGPQPQPWFHNIILVHFGSIFLPHFSKKSPPPHLNRCYSVRVHPCAHPQHMNVLKHFIYLQYGCGMQFGTSCSLNHDTTTSFGSTLPHLHRCYSKVGSTGPTTAYEGSNTSYTSNMDVGCSLGPLAASTMTPQRHLAPRYPTSTGVTVRLDPQAQPQHMKVQTLHIPPIWMWDAVWDLLQPQP